MIEKNHVLATTGFKVPSEATPRAVKPGFKTTEFVLAAIVIAFAITAAGLGLANDKLDAGGALALVSGAVASVGYAASRARVKSAH